MAGLAGVERPGLAFKAPRPVGKLVGGATASSASFFCPEQPVFDSGQSDSISQLGHPGHEAMPGSVGGRLAGASRPSPFSFRELRGRPAFSRHPLQGGQLDPAGADGGIWPGGGGLLRGARPTQATVGALAPPPSPPVAFGGKSSGATAAL